MSRYRTFLMTAIFGSALLLASAMAQQAPKPADKTPPAAGAQAAKPGQPAKIEPPKEDPKATEVLTQAVDRSKKLDWIETTLWQQMDMQGLTFQAEGTYVSGPQHRLHLDLEVRVGGTTGNLKVISDGTTLWEEMKIGDRPWQVNRKVDLNSVLDVLNTPDYPKDVVTEVRDAFFQNQAFAGVTPLLQTIQVRMKVTKQEKVQWKGHDVIRLTAVWPVEVANAVTQNGKQPWVAFLPRECRLYLDEQTRWPYRLEWWGPSPPRRDDGLLVQMEFRNPKFQALSADQIAREFFFEPPSEDETNRVDSTPRDKDLVTRHAQALKDARDKKPVEKPKAPDSSKPTENKPPAK